MDARMPSIFTPNYGFDCCTAEKAIDGNPNSFAIPLENKKGIWWEASFRNGTAAVSHVRILNRPTDGERLAAAKVTIDDQECGSLPDRTENGKWYEVKCSSALVGSKVRITQTRDQFLQISMVEVYGHVNGAAGNGRRVLEQTV
jgi:hypothetical protein